MFQTSRKVLFGKNMEVDETSGRLSRSSGHHCSGSVLRCVLLSGACSGESGTSMRGGIAWLMGDDITVCGGEAGGMLRRLSTSAATVLMESRVRSSLSKSCRFDQE